jgi:D-alanyl-lipoteichoic acid acyltransferase DltB (MBOAT superfamily)
MLFNSVVFLKFFAAFLLLYFLARRSLRARNWLIIAASYLFYGWWDYRFLCLLFASSVLDYSVGLGIERSQTQRRRRLWLCLSLAGNLGMLGFFKYYGFFVDSLVALLAQLGIAAHPRTLRLVLPVGISFYTFQTMSYALDVYRRQIPPTRSFVNFLAYVSFFPQLVAGPIGRATYLLPQFECPRLISRQMLAEGVWLMLWGMFKKVVLADNLAPLVELAYAQPLGSGPLVALGTIAFGFQIYGDFSGYSDIGRGAAKVLGFDLMLNFNLPYVATNVREFWRRWHISLSSWLRDYLYISLGGNRRGPGRTRLNLLLTMLLGGLWHGAAWNFVLWGGWHGLGLLAHRWWGGRRAAAGSQPGQPATAAGRVAAWLFTMLFVFYGWLLFRANSFDLIVAHTAALANSACPVWIGSYLINVLVFTLPLVAVQIWQAKTGNLLAPLTLPPWARYGLQGALLGCILLFWEKDSTPFIYFQF